MPTLTIEGLDKPKDPELLGHEKASTIADAQEFLHYWLLADTNREPDRKVAYVIKYLEEGRFWSVLSLIDGNREENHEKREEKRAWARAKFSDQELDRLLRVCFETAVRVPRDLNLPGAYRGHIILWEELVLKSDTMFSKHITRDVKKYLNNGRFWEGFASSGYWTSSNGFEDFLDVLVNHYDDLDPQFVGQGIEIAKRELGRNRLKPNFARLSNKQLDKYMDFVFDAAVKVGLDEESLGILIAPYAAACIQFRQQADEEKRLRFPLGNKGSWQERLLHDGRVARTVAYSGVARDALASELVDQIKGYGDDWKHALDVLEAIPNGQEVFNNVYLKFEEPAEAYVRLLKNCHKAGRALKFLPNPQKD